MAIPFISELPELEPRGYFMRHKTGRDVGFSWNKDDPNYSDAWERIPAVPGEGRIFKSAVNKVFQKTSGDESD